MVGQTRHLQGEENHMNGGDGLPDIVQTIQKLQNRLEDEGDTVEPLKKILCNKSMQALIKVHERMRPSEEHTSGPVASNTFNLIHELELDLRSSGSSRQEVDELSNLFAHSPHLSALLQCHDQIASQDFEPMLPEAEPNDSFLGDEEESMKVVRLVKGNEPLGATIAVDELTNNIVIARILKGGAADRSGLIHVNDILVEVNKVPASGKKPEELIQLLADFRGPLTFRLIPGESSLETQEKEEPPMYVRAKFAYHPERDQLIPCAEAGLAFGKNDVLKIVSRDDESWWQASVAKEGIHARNINDRQEGSHHKGRHLHSSNMSRAGLIPSAKLQTRRDTLRRQATIKNIKGSSTSLTSGDQKERRSAWSLLRQSFRRSNKSLNRSTPSLDHSKYEEPLHTEPACTIAYEEVTLLPPAADTPKESRYFRPIVLVGPQGVGRNELKDRLIDSNPTHYGVPVPHTSRAKLDEEEDGKDYHFVSREYMENGIRNNMFLEYGEYKGNLYGTSLDAVKAVIRNQQVCVLTPYPQALKVLRNSDLKPFVMFVKPPAMDVLSGSSKNVETKMIIDGEMAVPFSTEELHDLVMRGEKMENSFGHWFDYTIVNDGVDRAFSEVKQVVFAVENEPQWVPKEWMRGDSAT